MTYSFEPRKTAAIFEEVLDEMEASFETMEFGPTVIESDPWIDADDLDPRHEYSGLVHPGDPVEALLDSDEARTHWVVSHHWPR